MSKPLVSVIIPTCSRHNFLRQAIRSVLNQTVQDFEIVVVNDGGENVGPLLAAMHDSRLIWRDLPRSLGPGHARNVGLQMAQGEYLGFLDDDDILFPRHLEVLRNAIGKAGRRVVYSDSVRAMLAPVAKGHKTIFREPYFSENYFLLKLLVKNIFPINCLLFHRSCIDDGIRFDEQLRTHEDWDFWIRIALRFSFHHVKRRTVEVRFRYDKSTATSSLADDFRRTRELVGQRYLGCLRQEIERLNARAALSPEEALWLAIALKSTGRTEHSRSRFQQVLEGSSSLRMRAEACFFLDSLAPKSRVANGETWNRQGVGYLLRRHRRSPRDLFLIGKKLYEIGDFHRCLHWLESAHTHPGLPPDQQIAAAYMLGIAYQRRSQPRQAEQVARHALAALIRQRIKSDLESYRIASFHHLLGNSRKACVWYRRVLACSTQDWLCAGAHFHLGEIQAGWGRLNMARRSFRACLRRLPEHRQARESLARLAGEGDRRPAESPRIPFDRQRAGSRANPGRHARTKETSNGTRKG